MSLQKEDVNLTKRKKIVLITWADIFKRTVVNFFKKIILLWV